MPTRRMSVMSSFSCSVNINLYQSVTSLTSSLADYKYNSLPRRPQSKYRSRPTSYLTTGYSTYSSVVSKRDAFLSEVLRTPIKTTRYTPEVFRPVVRDVPTFSNYYRPPTTGYRRDIPEKRGISRYRQLIILRDKKTDRGDSQRSNDSGIDIGLKTSFRETECTENGGRKSSCQETEPEVDNKQETECKSNCHRKCEQHMPNLCGVNEKLLSEMLSTVKKDMTVISPVSRDAQSKVGECRGRPLTPGSSDSDDNCDHLLERLTSTLGACPEKEDKSTLSLKYRKYMVDDFNFLKVLGRGSYGKVMLAESKDHSHYFAIKCLKKDVVLEGNDVECTKIEKKVLALGTAHPYICKLYCTFQTQSHLFFVMEYLCGGDLMFHIQQSGRFDQERARFYASEIVSALKFLHKKGIVYRDAKLDNIVLDSDGHIRLVDFGFCKFRIYRKECLPKNLCGTPDYMAPEIIRGQRYNQSVDWWSFGVLLYEMLVGQSPFTGSDEEELFWSICNEEAYYPRFLSKEAKQLLVLLLDKTPETRLGMSDCTAGDVCHQPFFRTINWEKVERKEVQPPFKPNLRGPNDVSNFDSDFTTEKAVLTPIAPEILASMDQTQFKGFTYTNPNITE